MRDAGCSSALEPVGRIYGIESQRTAYLSAGMTTIRELFLLFHIHASIEKGNFREPERIIHNVSIDDTID